MQSLDEIRDTLQTLIDIQFTDGTWNYDEYHYGILIGLLIAKSVLYDDDIDLPPTPEKWLRDINEEKKFSEKLKKYPMVKDAYVEYCILRALSGFDDED